MVHEARRDMQCYLISSFWIHFLATNCSLRGQWLKDRTWWASYWIAQLLGFWSEYNRSYHESCYGDEMRLSSVVSDTCRADTYTEQLLTQSLEDWESRLFKSCNKSPSKAIVCPPCVPLVPVATEDTKHLTNVHAFLPVDKMISSSWVWWLHFNIYYVFGMHQSQPHSHDKHTQTQNK